MRFADIRPGTLQGYFLASFLFMAIVFSLPICLGLAALALDLPVGTPFHLHIPSSAEVCSIASKAASAHLHHGRPVLL